MTRHWHTRHESLEIEQMPFYWRLPTPSPEATSVPARMPVRLTAHEEHDYLCLRPAPQEWETLEYAYQQDATIGFLNPESGQEATYGASVNSFVLSALESFQPRRIYEIGCGAGHSIVYLREHGWNVVGVDPSEYSRRWSEQAGFRLINEFFDADTVAPAADFIYCNDVFEHIPDVSSFARAVAESLEPGGLFAVCTTNSERSIALGDVSMLEHQHVNMFTSGSIESILVDAGFGSVKIAQGSYGNTFHVIARKGNVSPTSKRDRRVTAGFFERCSDLLSRFEHFYADRGEDCGFYVPLRCIPYLASQGVYDRPTYDSNAAWRGGILDGYHHPILGLPDLASSRPRYMFIGSLTFAEPITQSLVDLGFERQSIFTVLDV